MRITPLRLALMLALVAFAGAPNPARATWSNDPFSPNSIYAGAGNRSGPMVCADGAGGMIVTWLDYRAGNYDVYAQRLNSNGDLLWNSNGLLIAGGLHSQAPTGILADGAGGAYILWTESVSGFDSSAVFIQRIGPSGAAFGGWPATGQRLSVWNRGVNGAGLCTGTASDVFVGFSKNSSDTTFIAVNRVTSAGTVMWGTGTQVSSGLRYLTYEQIVPDALGGAYVFWNGWNNSYYRVAMQRVNSAGAVLLAAGGVQPSGYSGNQNTVRAFPDGTGGVFMAHNMTFPSTTSGQDIGFVRYSAGGGSSSSWITIENQDQALFAACSDGQYGMYLLWGDTYYGYGSYNRLILSRYRMNGSNALGWPSVGGVQVSAGSGAFYNYSPYYALVADGTNVVYVVYPSYSELGGLGAKRYTATGTTWPAWPANGVVTDLIGGPTLSAVADPSGGLFIATSDNTLLSMSQIGAERVDAFGRLGAPAPRIAAVRDVPFDQGGHIKLSWNPSYLDAGPGYEISKYSVWRSVPPTAAQAALAAGAKMMATGDAGAAEIAAAGGRILRTSVLAGNTIYWEQVGEQPALAQPGYSFLVPTTSDSIGAGNPRTLVQVIAHSGSSIAFYTSPADSGYSVDNLPPVVPAPFTGQYGGGIARLHWDRNAEADLAGYRLYRGTSTGFTPAGGNLVAALPDTGYAYAAGAPYYYKLTAVDSHGNESPAAALLPAGTLDADMTAPPAALSLALASASPSASGASLRFELPRASHVKLALYDVSGRAVRVVSEADLGPGRYLREWDGRDEAGGQVGSGLYFARLEANGRSLVSRVAIVR
jgi:hypothetical protein